MADECGESVHSYAYACMLTAGTRRSRYTFFIESEQKAALEAIKERDGVPESEQIRRAIDAWIEEKGGTKADRKRAPTRKRP